MARTKTAVRMTAVTVLAAAFLLGAMPAAYAEKTIALSTGTFELSLAAGDAASETVAVANNGDEPFAALVYTSDVTYDDAGVPEYNKPTGEPGEFLKSPASWLSLSMPQNTKVIANTPYIELAPGEELLIDFSIAVPDGAAPGDYNAVVFFEMFDNEQQSGTSSKVSGRIGARIVVRVAGDVVERVDVAPFAVKGFIIGDAVPFSFTVSNTGNIDKRYVPSLVVLDSTEAEVQRTELEETAIVYAGLDRAYSGTVALDKPLFGKYIMRAELMYDREGSSASAVAVSDMVTKDRTFWVFPLWFAVLVVLVVGLPLLWLVWRSTRKSAVRRSRRGTVRASAGQEDDSESAAHTEEQG